MPKAKAADPEWQKHQRATYRAFKEMRRRRPAEFAKLYDWFINHDSPGTPGRIPIHVKIPHPNSNKCAECGRNYPCPAAKRRLKALSRVSDDARNA